MDIPKNIKKDMEELDILIGKILDKEIDNFKLQKDLNKDFWEKGLNQRLVKCLFSGTKVISDMNDIEKMTFADTCYKILKNEQFNILQYYSYNKVAEWNNYISVSEKIDEIYCEDFRRINSYEYHGDFTYEQVYKYMKNILWLYYPSTQRSSKYKEKNSDSIIREINVNKKSVNEISNLILDDKFEPTEIILNCMLFKGKTPQLKFDKRYKEIGDITIRPNYDVDNDNYTICTILDGYHRILGICKAVEIHQEKTGQWLEGNISCKLVLADIVRAKRIVELVFKRTDDDKNWLKSLEQSDYTEFVDMIISNSSVLKNNVADIYEQCKYDNKITYKVILTETIKKLKIDVTNKSTTLFSANDMAKIIDYIFNIISKEKNSTSEFEMYYKLPNMFVGYFTVAYMLKDREQNLNEYISIVNNIKNTINDDIVKFLKLDNKKCCVNKIIMCFEEIVEGVIQ